MTLFILIGMTFPPKRLVLPVAFDDIFMDRNAREDHLALGVGKTWGSGCCSAVCASQLPIKNGGPHDGNVMRALG